MMNQKDQKMDPCNASECVSITKKEFLAYAFDSKCQYIMIFDILEGEDPKEFCEKQVMLI